MSEDQKPAEAKPGAEDWRKELSLREQAFVEEYLVDLNATQAAIRCGVKKNSAHNIGSRMRRLPRVNAAIKTLFEARGISKVRIVEELAKTAFANSRDFVKVEGGRVVITETDKLTEEQTAAIAKVSETIDEAGNATVKVEMYDKLGALAHLGKASRLFVERAEVSGPNGGDIPLDMKVSVRQRLQDRLDRMAKKLAEGKPDESKAAEAPKQE